MTTIDHKAEAEESLRGAGDGRNVATDASNNAIAHALLYLAEQQRIANLIALANSDHRILKEQVAEDAAEALTDFHEHSMGGYFQVNPDIAHALGIETEDAGA